MGNLDALTMNYANLNEDEMYDIEGGVISITIGAVTFVGWAAWTLIGAGVTTLAGAAALGIYNGYNSTKRK